MAAHSAQRRAAVASIAALTRHRDADDPDVAAARQRIRELGAEEYVRELVESAPPLPVEIRARLAAILLGRAS